MLLEALLRHFEISTMLPHNRLRRLKKINGNTDTTESPLTNTKTKLDLTKLFGRYLTTTIYLQK